MSTLLNAAKDYRDADYVFDYQDTIKVNIFIDHSIIEVFVDQLVVFSGRVYPSKTESLKTDLVVSNGKVTINRVDGWQMKSFGDEMEDEVCEPVNLPDSLREGPSGFGNLNRYRQLKMKTFPNPADDELFVEAQKISELNIGIQDLNGRRIYCPVEKIEPNKARVHLGSLPKGIYLCSLRTDNAILASQKFIVN
jgi:hypothetical protein